jgi:hypothetical protein
VRLGVINISSDGIGLAGGQHGSDFETGARSMPHCAVLRANAEVLWCCVGQNEASALAA